MKGRGWEWVKEEVEKEWWKWGSKNEGMEWEGVKEEVEVDW
jgi:hypothetical protein